VGKACWSAAEVATADDVDCASSAARALAVEESSHISAASDAAVVGGHTATKAHSAIPSSTDRYHFVRLARHVESLPVAVLRR